MDKFIEIRGRILLFTASAKTNYYDPREIMNETMQEVELFQTDLYALCTEIFTSYIIYELNGNWGIP